MNLRDRVKQTAVVVSDTEYTLTSGTAAEGHLTFEAGFPIPSTGDLGGDVDWDNVPVLVEVGDGTWQTLICTLRRANDGTITLRDGVLQSSSTGAALGLAAAVVVNVTLAPIAALFHNFAIAARALLGTLPGLQSGGDIALFDTCYVDNGGLMAMGRKTYSVAKFGTISGDFMYCPQAGAQYYGFGGITHGAGDVESALGVGVVRNAYTTNATPAKLGLTTYDGAVAGADTFYLDAGLHVFEGFVTAIDLATGDHKVWAVRVAAKTSLDYATTDILGTPTFDVIDQTGGGTTGWALTAVGVDADNEIYFENTGEAATDISWQFTGRHHHHVVYV